MASSTHPLNQVQPDLFNEDLWEWIIEHEAFSVSDLRLKYGTAEPYHSAIAQIEAKKKYASKFKSLFEEQWIFPAGLALEQSSSLATASYKSSLLATPYSADLCAGMGIDSRALSLRDECKRHLCFEQNQGLAALLKHNLKKSTIVPTPFELKTLENWIKENNVHQSELTVYLDPDRRVNKTRTFAIEEGTPNLIDIQGDLLALAARVITKHSPMVDILQCTRKLVGLKRIHVVQHQGECKEILTVQVPGNKEKPYLTVVEATSGHSIDHPYPSSFAITHGPLSNYIIQPSASLNKSELHDLLANLHDWKRLGVGNIYTSATLPETSPFYKIFKVKAAFDSVKKVKLSGDYAIESIGSKITARELRKRLHLKEGRAQKLFYLQNGRTKLIVEGLLIE